MAGAVGLSEEEEAALMVSLSLLSMTTGRGRRGGASSSS